MLNPFTGPTLWSDRKKWWMDLLKSGVGFLIGGLITSMLVSRCDGQRQRNTFAWQAWYGLRVAAMGDFARASATFSVNATDAIHSKACQKALPATAPCALGDRASLSILEWRGKDVNEVDVAVRAIFVAFSQVDPTVQASLSKETAVLEMQRNSLLELFNHAGEESCEEAGWAKLANGKLKDSRQRYDEAAQSILGNLRSQVGSSQ